MELQYFFSFLGGSSKQFRLQGFLYVKNTSRF